MCGNQNHSNYVKFQNFVYLLIDHLHFIMQKHDIEGRDKVDITLLCMGTHT